MFKAFSNLIVAFVFATTAEAALVQTVISAFTFEQLVEGRNRISGDVADYTDVRKTDDGFAFEILTLNDVDRIPVWVSWEGGKDSWFRLEVNTIVLNGRDSMDFFDNDFFVATDVQFDPWGRPETTAISELPRTYVFPNREGQNNLLLFPCYCSQPIPDGGNRISFEYSLQEMAAPLPADFNYDNQVDFSDFLILSTLFGFRRSTIQASLPMHFRGDADMSGDTSFNDYLILRDSYGAIRPAVASVPEPSASWIARTVLTSVLLCLRGRRRELCQRVD